MGLEKNREHGKTKNEELLRIVGLRTKDNDRKYNKEELD